MKTDPTDRNLTTNVPLAPATSEPQAVEPDQGAAERPRPLEVAESEFATVAEYLCKIGAGQFDALVQLSEKLASVKNAFKKTPWAQRPVKLKSWGKYSRTLSERYGLNFATREMANNYVRLHSDILEAGGVEKVKALAPDGSYRSVTSAVRKLLGKSAPKKAAKTEPSTEVKTATDCLRRALEEILAAEEIEANSLKFKEIKSALQALIGNGVDAQKPSAEIKLATPGLPPPTSKKVENAEDESHPKMQQFKPTCVAQIAEALGGQSALSRAAQKKGNGHAAFWVKNNKFPMALRPLLIEVFHKLGQTLDMTQIKPTR